MNILHLMKDYKPNSGGSVVRNSNILERAKMNRENKFYIINLDGNNFNKNSIENDIEVIRCKNIIELFFQAFRVVSNKKIDIIHAHNFRFIFIGYVLHLFYRKTSIIGELHAIYTMAVWKEHVSYKILNKLDKIIVLSNSAKKYLVNNHNLKEEKIEVIMNGIDIDSLSTKKESDILSDTIKLKDSNYIIMSYIGSFFEWQGVIFLANNLNLILEKNKNLIVQMVGDGPCYREVENIIGKSKYKDRIMLHPNLEKSKINLLMDYIDIIVIPREKKITTNTAVPLKVVDAMIFQKAILADDDEGLAELLNTNNSVIFKSMDSDDFIRKVEFIVANKTYRDKIAEKAYKDVIDKISTWDECAKSLNHIYSKGIIDR